MGGVRACSPTIHHQYGSVEALMQLCNSPVLSSVQKFPPPKMVPSGEERGWGSQFPFFVVHTEL